MSLRQVKKSCRTIPILLTTKIQKTCKDFQKDLEIKTSGNTAIATPEVTIIIKNNDRGINDHNTTRETDLQLGRYNHYFKVPTRDNSNSKQRYPEL